MTFNCSVHSVLCSVVIIEMSSLVFFNTENNRLDKACSNTVFVQIYFNLFLVMYEIIVVLQFLYQDI